VGGSAAPAHGDGAPACVDMVDPRAAYREKVLIEAEKQFQDDINFLKEKLLVDFGQLVDVQRIDSICQVMCDKFKGCCSVCKTRCIEAVVDSVKIMVEAMSIKHQEILIPWTL